MAITRTARSLMPRYAAASPAKYPYKRYRSYMDSLKGKTFCRHNLQPFWISWSTTTRQRDAFTSLSLCARVPRAPAPLSPDPPLLSLGHRPPSAHSFALTAPFRFRPDREYPIHMASALTKVRIRGIAIILAIVWAGISLGWSWSLIRQGFERTMSRQLTRHADRIMLDLADVTPPGLDLTDRKILPQLADLSEVLEVEQRHDRSLAYGMVWDANGGIVAHTDRAKINSQSLPSAVYPPLERDENIRVKQLASVPFDEGIHDIYEITVPLRVNHAIKGYVSLGYNQPWIEQQFWLTQRSLLALAVAFTLAGVAAVLVGFYFAAQINERARQELLQNSRARTSLLTERGMLASVLAHEVRSPLTALRFNLHALRKYILTEVGTERQVELNDRCEREIRRLDLMLNDFLSRTQIIAPVVPTPINQVVDEALDFLRPALEQKHIRVITHLDGENPRVAVNPDELRQVLLNLAANAQDAMALPRPGGERGGTLTVSTVLNPEASNVTLLFRDSGVGIPPELHTRIFEPFFTTKPQGSGLGLALVRRVISGAGGTIFCESAVGEGTTFRIVLPLATEEITGAIPAPPTELPDIVIDHTLESDAEQTARGDSRSASS